ncbi:hypothetical protein UFOVP223_90 [uncultured Caudovirales phage]|uniref:Uncharacterized protein n=1 Tax=uncultured Caudovirales phage TaxID=2100421 RepID=A0A6J5L4L2_9CAUD|nr:hypothetical protein UFOVP110_74 [uncultured Caudovirales phage]CAB5219542.1 hypothetical protein UFOVP223_90 [uncultured Caudovirales phage]
MAIWHPDGFINLVSSGTNSLNLYYYYTFNDNYSTPSRSIVVTDITTSTVIYSSSSTSGASGSSGGTNGSNGIVLYNLQAGHNFTARLYASAYYFIPGSTFTVDQTVYASTDSYAPSWIDTSFTEFRAETSVQTSGRDSSIGAQLANTYSITNGALPTGVSFSKVTLPVYPGNYVQFSGTPTVPGQSYSFTFTATGDGGTANVSFAGNVAPSRYGTVCVWNGSTWVEDQVKVRNSGNTSWDLATVYVRNSANTAWVKTRPKDAINY